MRVVDAEHDGAKAAAFAAAVPPRRAMVGAPTGDLAPLPGVGHRYAPASDVAREPADVEVRRELAPPHRRVVGGVALNGLEVVEVVQGEGGERRVVRDVLRPRPVDLHAPFVVGVLGVERFGEIGVVAPSASVCSLLARRTPPAPADPDAPWSPRRPSGTTRKAWVSPEGPPSAGSPGRSDPADRRREPAGRCSSATPVEPSLASPPVPASSAVSVVSAMVSMGAVWRTGGAFGLAAFGVDAAIVAGAGRECLGSLPPAAGPPLAPDPASDVAVGDVGVVLVEDVPPAAEDLVDGVADDAHIGGAANGVNVEGFEDAAAAEDVAVAVVVPPEDAEVAEVAEVGPAAAAPLAAAAADILADPSTVIR